MADIRGVWGIDIGLAGLKAIRLVYAESAKQVLATAFDYVPHPKILSQPDANPDELIAQALDTFLSRNPLAGDGVAISVPGQTALARFIQLPPVEASKVVEIVKYEARQQIPFALEEVIWDYQPLGGGVEESGFMLDAKVGLFAMKRDQVQQHLAPFLARKVEVDLVQIAPLALYNYLCHDRFGVAPGRAAPDEEEDHTLLLDMGADNTTLLVSNGKDIWIRNVPLGGNHFTRALTKEMKLTFAKAEHLKVNATKSPDPKAVFQALRPVFNDYVSEIQRSIGFFSSVNREAKIGRIVGVGNGFKLAGLQKFLQQNLQMDVERVDSFPALAGDSVVNAPLFQENLLSFAVPYGLALQGLKITRVHTSLLPPEITTARMIRKKKPWAVATAALLLLGLATSTMGYSHVWNMVSTNRFGEAETKAKGVIELKTSQKSAYDKEVAGNKTLKDNLNALVAGADGRTQWLELYKAINACLPRDYGVAAEEPDPTKKNRIRIMKISAEKTDDLGTWFKGLAQDSTIHMRADERAKGPTGPGYIVRLQGKHFHSEEEVMMRGVNYVAATFLNKGLQQWSVEQVDLISEQPTGLVVPVGKMGISHATIASSLPTSGVIYYEGGPGTGRGLGGPGVGGAGAGEAGVGTDDDGPAAGLAPVAAGVRGGGGRGGKPGKKGGGAKRPELDIEGDASKGREIKQTEFWIEFAWKPIPEKDRTETDPNVKPPEGPSGAVAEGSAKTPAAAGGAPGSPSAKTGASTPTGAAAGPAPGGSPAGGAAPGGQPAGAVPGGAVTPVQPPAGGPDPTGQSPAGKKPPGG
ncbi:MAG: type IV pilus assembly protein PilM [Planctomycetaceae bacterium]|nr:type IV pilus assembly protein PilM [Planctomycetaceae bacterium]